MVDTISLKSICTYPLSFFVSMFVCLLIGFLLSLFMVKSLDRKSIGLSAFHSALLYGLLPAFYHWTHVTGFGFSALISRFLDGLFFMIVLIAFSVCILLLTTFVISMLNKRALFFDVSLSRVWLFATLIVLLDGIWTFVLPLMLCRW